MSTLLTDYNELVDYLNRCLQDNDTGSATLDNGVYEALLSHAYRFELDHPDLARRDTPTLSLGADLPLSRGSVLHLTRMWGLGTITAMDDVERFLKSTKVKEFSVECKYNGVAIELVYMAGRLFSASTRGNGITGVDILDKARLISSIPRTIEHQDLLIVHGALVLKKETFQLQKERMTKIGLTPTEDIRHMTVAILEGLDEYASMLSFKAYWSNGVETKHSQRMRHLMELGFVTTFHDPLIEKDQVADRISSIADLRELYPYPLDGVVITVDDDADRKRIGFGNKSPRYATAYRFCKSTAVTLVNDIIFKVTSQGVLTPVAVLEPVKIDGHMVNKAALHSLSVMSVLDVRIGDEVEVSRNSEGSVQVVRVFPDKRASDIVPVTIPTHCPSCHHELWLQPDRKSTLICPSGRFCKEKIAAKVSCYLSPKGINVPLNVIAIERLIETGKVKQVVDVYKLTREDLTAYAGLSEKHASETAEKLLKARDLPFRAHLTSLGIPTVSVHVAEELTKRFKDFNQFLEHFTKTEKTDTLSMSVSDVAIMEWCNRFDNRLMVTLLAQFLDKCHHG